MKQTANRLAFGAFGPYCEENQGRCSPRAHAHTKEDDGASPHCIPYANAKKEGNPSSSRSRRGSSRKGEAIIKVLPAVSDSDEACSDHAGRDAPCEGGGGLAECICNVEAGLLALVRCMEKCHARTDECLCSLETRIDALEALHRHASSRR